MILSLIWISILSDKFAVRHGNWVRSKLRNWNRIGSEFNRVPWNFKPEAQSDFTLYVMMFQRCQQDSKRESQQDSRNEQDNKESVHVHWPFQEHRSKNNKSRTFPIDFCMQSFWKDFLTLFFHLRFMWKLWWCCWWASTQQFIKLIIKIEERI